jgi:hypothetical protein
MHQNIQVSRLSPNAAFVLPQPVEFCSLKIGFIDSSVFRLVLRTTTGSLRSVFNTRTKYHEAPNTENTELHTLNAPKSEQTRIIESNVASRSDSEQASPIQHDLRATIKRYKHRISGWKFCLLNFAVWVSIVFAINLVVTVWGAVPHKENEGVLSQRDCGRIKKLNSGLHILFNMFGTILLSGNSYFMQCMSAPNRKEIDETNAAQRWLDIGVPSFRNFKHIRRGRLVLWVLLGLNSVLLHLL